MPLGYALCGLTGINVLDMSLREACYVCSGAQIRFLSGLEVIGDMLDPKGTDKKKTTGFAAAIDGFGLRAEANKVGYGIKNAVQSNSTSQQ